MGSPTNVRFAHCQRAGQAGPLLWGLSQEQLTHTHTHTGPIYGPKFPCFPLCSETRRNFGNNPTREQAQPLGWEKKPEVWQWGRSRAA